MSGYDSDSTVVDTSVWLHVHEGPCPVCANTLPELQAMGRVTLVLPCKHIICLPCSVQWKRVKGRDFTCPLCREETNLNTFRKPSRCTGCGEVGHNSLTCKMVKKAFIADEVAKAKSKSTPVGTKRPRPAQGAYEEPSDEDEEEESDENYEEGGSDKE